MEITYRIKRADLWRSAIYTNIHHPQVLGYLLFLVFMLLLNVSLPLLAGDLFGALRAGVQFLVLVFFVLFVIIAFRIYKRIPSESTVRFCTERIGPYGFECIVPEGHRYAAWSDVLKITQTNQDLFVFAKKGKSYIIPKHVFDSPEHAQAFFEKANGYWVIAKAGRTVTVPHDETVWPPAPRSGA